MKKIGEAIALIVLIPVVIALVLFLGVWLVGILGLFLLLAGICVIADMTFTVTENGKKIGTWRRTTGFVREKNDGKA